MTLLSPAKSLATEQGREAGDPADTNTKWTGSGKQKKTRMRNNNISLTFHDLQYEEERESKNRMMKENNNNI